MTKMLPLLFLAACGTDLPADWEDALLVESFTQSACGGDPYEGYQWTLSASQTGTTLEVDWTEAHFRCEQDLEAWYMADASAVQFLVRPVDMSPKEVARCDCLYDVGMRISGQFESVESLSVWWQWDDLNEPNDPVLLATLVAE